ncbi:RepB family plasmid replication initiator protein [Siphonobacter sp. BAB-5405]|uniref:RepB family plasmid replication initiator protein n=1 Tax=Siphonobacter sp. BAB-5405 TaxID=1864825 RepID=UPI001304FCF0|nr:RepB family plasmid replication initiator protein [Siphonobacter sp. BAB-5405]
MEKKLNPRKNTRKKKRNNTVVLIRKSNALVEAHYKFTIWETRVFAKMISMIDWEDRDFKEYKIFSGMSFRISAYARTVVPTKISKKEPAA